MPELLFWDFDVAGLGQSRRVDRAGICLLSPAQPPQPVGGGVCWHYMFIPASTVRMATLFYVPSTNNSFH